MRLGEGTGALVALPMLDSAAALLRDVAALSDLGVARED
jgi:nicotinate-nucleotide--dimethylbenzimidazole phosphoribosyltransferase